MGKELKELEGLEQELVERKEFRKAQDLYTDWIAEKAASPGQHQKEVALAYNNRGRLKYLEVDFEGAVLDYGKAVDLDPSLASAHYNRGTISYRMGCFDKAILDMKKAVELSPENAEFALGLKRCSEGNEGRERGGLKECL